MTAAHCRRCSLLICTALFGLVGCQPTALDGPSLRLLETSRPPAEMVPTKQSPTQPIRTIGDLLKEADDGSNDAPTADVSQTVTAQAEQIREIVETPAPTSTSTSPSAPEPEPTVDTSLMLDEQFSEALAAHNAVRAETGLPPLVWDTEYAQLSQRWANELAVLGVLQHDPNANAWEIVSQQPAGTAAKEIVQSPIFGWASDREREVFAATGGCPADHEQFVICGHYRIIIDPQLTSVGCGMATAGIWDFWVCRLR